MTGPNHAVILAAGRGSRLTELTRHCPKCLVRFVGKTLLQWQLEALRGAGIKHVGVVTGYRGDLLDQPGLKQFRNVRWAQTNMVSSLTTASDWLRSNPCVVSYGDIVYSADAVRRLLRTHGDIAIAYDPNWLELWSLRFKNPLCDAETFVADQHGRLLEIGDRATQLENIRGQFMGLLKFTPLGWQTTERCLGGLTSGEHDRLDTTGLLQHLLAMKVPIETVPIGDRWFEIDSPSDLTAYKRLISPDAPDLFARSIGGDGSTAGPGALPNPPTRKSTRCG